MSDEGIYRGMMAACILVLCFCMFGCFMSIKQTTKFREQCDAKHGVVFRGKSGLICLDRSVVL